MDEEVEGHRKPLGREKDAEQLAVPAARLVPHPTHNPTPGVVCEWSQCRRKQRGWTDRQSPEDTV